MVKIASAHLSKNLKCTLGAPLPRILKLQRTSFRRQKALNNSLRLLIRRLNSVLFYWLFSVKLFKQVTKRVHNFRLKVIKICDQTGAPKGFLSWLILVNNIFTVTDLPKIIQTIYFWPSSLFSCNKDSAVSSLCNPCFKIAAQT